MTEVNTTVVLVVLLIASVFYMIQSCILCDEFTCTSYEGYAVAVGVISLVLSAGLLVLGFAGSTNEQINIAASLFFFVWWGAGTSIGTFKAPYQTNGTLNYPNGYFAAWIALLASAYFVILCISAIKGLAASVSRTGAVIGVLLISSVFYLTAAGIACDSSTCTSWEGYAVAVGAIGTFLCLGLLALNLIKEDLLYSAGKFIAMFLLLWWAIGCGFTTFKEPFQGLGNGYFSAWFALGASAFLLSVLMPGVGEKVGISGNSEAPPPAYDTEEGKSGDWPEQPAQSEM